MRICACLWGGVYNPIIPVFRTPPKEWQPEHSERVKGYSVARGYIEFFEPDAYVEAEAGLLEKVGLGTLRERHGLHRRVIPLGDFLRQLEHRDWSEPEFGLGIIEALEQIYEKEQRFELRDRRTAFLVRPQRGTALVEAMFGAYPGETPARYIGKGFADVYRPETLPANAEAWRRVFLSDAATPLSVTCYGLEDNRSWMHDLVVFVFDPEKSTDLIDLWNLRLEPNPILPVPFPWFENVAGDIRKALIAEHRPLQGNPNGVMHHGTVEFARSIDEERRNAALEHLRPMPEGTLTYKTWRTRVWVPHTDDMVRRDTRLEVTAKVRHLTLDTQEGDRAIARFDALSPDFAAHYGGREMRWVNSVRIRSFDSANIATVVPFNTFDWSWPRLDFLGEEVGVGTEGWIFAQKYKESSEAIELHTHESIIVGALKRAGIDAKLSEPGHIARQVLNHLGGLWGVHLLADRGTLRLLNEMAGGIRRRLSDGVESEEAFDRRSRPVKDWQGLVARRSQAGLGPEVTLEDFTRRNIIRLGVETECPHCRAANWHSLTATDYQLTCERCLKVYPFPQADLRTRNRNWVYRVIGPFSVPDFARGSYAALLALRMLEHYGASHDPKTFSTALALNFDGINAEADFVALQARDRVDHHERPHFIFGEAKSFGDGDLIKSKDLAKLKEIGAKMPGAFIAIAVLREDFTPTEKELIVPFVKWARRPNSVGEPTNPVLLLTGTELFYEWSVSSTWKKLGGRYAPYADYHHSRNLGNFAESTQAIYLELPPYREVRREYWAKRRARSVARKAAADDDPNQSPSAARSAGL